jgi:hypothetical protein
MDQRGPSEIFERHFDQKTARTAPTQLKLLARLTSPVPLYFGQAW